MNRLLVGCVMLVIAGAPTEAHAIGNDFTKDRIAVAGKHCVHGFWVNEQTVVFYAGDTSLLNRDLVRLLDGKYASRKVVIHAGTKRAESPWDAKPRDTFADWSVNTWDDPDDAAEAVPRMRMQIDIWLGSAIQLQDLRVPDGFEVVSGGEIEKFIQQRRSK
jgi:hypothetical protein